MILEISQDQRAYQQAIAAFAGTRVAPVASSIDDEGTFPRALIREAAALGLLGVTIPQAWGGAGRDYVELRAGARGARRAPARSSR